MVDMINKERRLNLSGVRANWVSAIIALIALFLGMYNLWKSIRSEKESLILEISKPKIDFPTDIKTIAGAKSWHPEMDVYWHVLLSNNSSNPVSITKYYITRLSPETNYPTSYKDLFSDSLKSMSVPLNIEANHSISFYIRTALFLDREAYNLISSKYGIYKGGLNSFRDVMEFLYSQGMDFQGNRIIKPWGYSTLQTQNPNDQTLLVKFETSKGSIITQQVSWYKDDHSLYR